MAREVKYLDPKALLIVGLDVEDENSPLADERAEWEVDEAMVRNIMVYGLQQPIIIRYEAGKAFVVDGRQRVKAARVAAQRQAKAGEYATKVPCIEVSADDARVGGIMVSANEIRKDDGVLGKARKASRLLDTVGDKEEVALAFGRSTKTIDNWMKLLSADPKIHEAIEAGSISAAVGIELAGKSRQKQIETLDQILSAPPATKSDGTKDNRTTPKPEKKKESGKEHPGVKKSWLRKAIKTAAFEELAQEDQEALNWILTGSAPKGHWLDDFTWKVDEEINQ
ncbi:hypothetical protein CMI37_19105 [Candidatus Pacearchaeota archaeon]|nr:hypothetical protein [Candidatus Pacearchaeota archaeon]|tara:strand:+ start:260 stop:1105 length:846 start_codon:yes stop_codon:yes gene_type:complete